MSFWKNFCKGSCKTAKVVTPLAAGVGIGANAGFWSGIGVTSQDWANGYNEACSDWNITDCYAYNPTDFKDVAIETSIISGSLIADFFAAVGITAVVSGAGGLTYASWKAFANYMWQDDDAVNIDGENTTVQVEAETTPLLK